MAQGKGNHQSGNRRSGRGPSGTGRDRVGKNGRSGSGAQRGGQGGRKSGGHGQDSRRKGSNRGQSAQRRAFSVDGGPGNLPRWLKDEILRVTQNDRREVTLTLLSEAAAEFAEGHFGPAHSKLLKAKQLSSRATAIRELLGLTAYRLDKWDEALRELRAFRRLAGDTSHMPIEMDALRALRRPDDVHKTWELYSELGGSPATDAEARVVYGSFLIDEGQPRSAWNIVKPKRLTKDADEFERRRWYVAARAAALVGDLETARKIATALDEADAKMVGLQELRDEIAEVAARGLDE